MSRLKPRKKGDCYRPVVKVLRDKDGIPTSIELGGNNYALVHGKYINGAKNKVKRKN